MLTMDSFLLPFIFLLCIGVSIVWNMGSNCFLGEISYITKAVAAVLQLAVTLDYSIFLWHSYKENKAVIADREEAMAKAIQLTFSSVLGRPDHRGWLHRPVCHELHTGPRLGHRHEQGRYPRRAGNGDAASLRHPDDGQGH